MRYLLVGGGTAGHINPAIAIAQEMRQQEPDAVIRFVGTPNGMEAKLVPQAGFDYVTIPSSGFRRNFKPKSIIHNLQTLGHLALANPRANKIMKDFRPDVVIGTGGYVTGAVVLAGVRYGAKTVIHEQNAYPGVTNKLLAKKVDKVLLAVEEAKPRMECQADFAVVGNPIRESVITKTRQEARQELGITDDRLVVLSFGGSLGARIINRMAADLMDHNRKGLYRHIHGYGQQGRDLFPQFLQERKVDLSQMNWIRATEYITDMDACLAAADLVICRSGAITLSELQAAGKASILVPSPYVAENHQYHNAMVLVNHGAAKIVEEAKYNREDFLRMIRDLVTHPEEIQKLSANAAKLAVLDSAQRCYREIHRLLQGE